MRKTKGVILKRFVAILFLCSWGASSLADGSNPHSSMGFHAANPPGKTPAMAEGPAATAVVEEVLEGGGYSYLKLRSSEGDVFWLAGIQPGIRTGDTVRYVENVVMENFTSRSLNRRFDRIVFASSVQVVP